MHNPINFIFRMNLTDSDNDMGNFEEGNRDKIQLRIIFMCFAIGVGVGVMACVHVGRKVSCSRTELPKSLEVPIMISDSSQR